MRWLQERLIVTGGLAKHHQKMSLVSAALLAFMVASIVDVGSGACVDYPLLWKDNEGCGCDAYEEAKLCEGGKISLSSITEEAIALYGRRETNAQQACCVCGGGIEEDAYTKQYKSISRDHAKMEQSFAVAAIDPNSSLAREAVLPPAVDLDFCRVSLVSRQCLVDSCRQPNRGMIRFRPLGYGELRFNGGVPQWADSRFSPLECVPCYDVLNWRDSDGFTCDDYHRLDLCAPGGQYGPAWAEDHLLRKRSFATFAVNGLDASVACCSCGGGILRDEAHCTSVEPVGNGSLVSPVACRNLPYGLSCEYKCDDGFFRYGDHTCQIGRRVFGGRCVRETSDGSMSEPPPTNPDYDQDAGRSIAMLINDTNLGEALARWDSVANPTRALLEPLTALGESEQYSDIGRIAQSLLYSASWYSFGFFIFKTKYKLHGFTTFALVCVFISLVYFINNIFSATVNSCSDFRRNIMSGFWVPVFCFITALTKDEQSQYLEGVRKINSARLAERADAMRTAAAAEKGAMEDASPPVVTDRFVDTVPADDAEDESFLEVATHALGRGGEGGRVGSNGIGDGSGDGKETSPAVENIKQDTVIATKENGLVQDLSLPFDIASSDMREAQSEGDFWLSGSYIVMSLIVISYLFGCDISGLLGDQAAYKSTGQSSTHKLHKAMLAVGGRSMLKTGDRNEFCAETKYELDPYWQVDMGKDYWLDQVWVRAGCDDEFDRDPRGEIQVQVVPDGFNMSMVCGGPFRPLSKKRQYVSDCRDIKARYVRIRFVGGPGLYKRLCICQVKVYALPRPRILTDIKKTMPTSKGLGCNDW